jgi:hypothetical protein
MRYMTPYRQAESLAFDMKNNPSIATELAKVLPVEVVKMAKEMFKEKV